MQIQQVDPAWLKGSFCPHYDAETNRRETYHEMVKAGHVQNGYGVSDRAALYYEDGELAGMVGEGDEAAVYRVELGDDGAVNETQLEIRILE